MPALLSGHAAGGGHAAAAGHAAVAGRFETHDNLLPRSARLFEPVTKPTNQPTINRAVGLKHWCSVGSMQGARASSTKSSRAFVTNAKRTNQPCVARTPGPARRVLLSTGACAHTREWHRYGHDVALHGVAWHGVAW